MPRDSRGAASPGTGEAVPALLAAPGAQVCPASITSICCAAQTQSRCAVENNTKQPTKSRGCPQYRKRAADALQLSGEAYTAAKQAQLCILGCNSDENPTRRLDVAVQVKKSAFIAAEG